MTTFDFVKRSNENSFNLLYYSQCVNNTFRIDQNMSNFDFDADDDMGSTAPKRSVEGTFKA